MIINFILEEQINHIYYLFEIINSNSQIFFKN